MLFSEPSFLFWFLPPLLLLYYVTPASWKNALLTCASLLFYSWGEYKFVALLVASIIFNYGIGRWIDRARAAGRAGAVLAVGISGNLALLAFFKYANFLLDNLNGLLLQTGHATIAAGRIPLPLGISFFTFKAMSYLIDVYRGPAVAQRSLIRLALYIALFPQVLAGPISQYRELAPQLPQHATSWAQFASGVSRFILGLAKKMMLASVVAWPADEIYSLPVSQLTLSLAWLGTCCYMLQIYLDFSAYSDMAIGVGRMFGFEFGENFNYPYISRSMTEFWRRWHISLSTWYRDYLYIPLGGNRLGPGRTYLNLVIVFLLCGLWHGASWTFVIWGLFNGLFLILERLPRLQSWASKSRTVQHVYLLTIVLVGWVFFRATSLSHGWGMLQAMIGLGAGDPAVRPVALYWSRELTFAIVVGALAATPVLPWCARWLEQQTHGRTVARALVSMACVGLQAVLLFYCALLMAGDTYQPFIYFRF